jgi:aspartate/glutamate racemase
MMKKLLIIVTVLTSFSVFAKDELMSTQIKMINDGIASGQITDATKSFFLESIADMKNPSAQSISRIKEFTRLVNEGITKGEISNETKEFFLQAVSDFNN